jgi:xanthine dehydrogenase YagS FAD-binding subunit
MEGDTVRAARIVLGAVASQPREAPEAARLLEGQRLADEIIQQVAARAAGPARPLDNTDLTHPYRKRMTRVFVERALRQLAADAPAAGPEAAA